jgi:sigma-E factor negative regulatory protein RseB
MKKSPVILAPVLVCLLMATETRAGEDSEPRIWLERMASAMSQMTYQGTFVYLTGDDMQTMRITHVSDGEGVRERLASLSGPAREIIRDSNGVRWVLGDSQSVFADSAFKKTFFPQMPLDHSSRAAGSYKLKIGEKNRIAGHQAVNVKVIPRDNYRYGYSLWLEKHSGLLLAWELLDSRRSPLAKLMFTDMRIGSEVDPGELKPAGQLQKYKTVGPSLPSGRTGAASQPRWRPSRLPPGFEMTVHRFHSLPGDENGVFEHLVYSDGLAAVSVYVESTAVAEGFHSGVKRHGTTHAFSRIEEDMLITVVGDVPALTVQLIGKSVEQVAP